MDRETKVVHNEAFFEGQVRDDQYTAMPQQRNKSRAFLKGGFL